MRHLLPLTILFSCFLSCKTKTEKAVTANSFQLLIQDTTNNRRAQWDLRTVNFFSKVENQLGLNDLKKRADSFEIRFWYDFSFSNSKELYTLKFQDTSCVLSYYRVYLRGINYDDENRNREWDPFTHPIIDSSFSKSALLTNDNLKNLHCDSVWFLQSQSELRISDSVGFTDCDTYIIEAADKKRFKFLRHHCPMSYYDKTKLTEILRFMGFFERVETLARKHNVVVPNVYD